MVTKSSKEYIYKISFLLFFHLIDKNTLHQNNKGILVTNNTLPFLQLKIKTTYIKEKKIINSEMP